MHFICKWRCWTVLPLFYKSLQSRVCPLVSIISVPLNWRKAQVSILAILTLNCPLTNWKRKVTKATLQRTIRQQSCVWESFSVFEKGKGVECDFLYQFKMICLFNVNAFDLHVTLLNTASSLLQVTVIKVLPSCEYNFSSPELKKSTGLYFSHSHPQPSLF